MKYYANRETTPMHFHKFLMYFGYPVSILSSISNVYNDWKTLKPYFPYLKTLDATVTNAVVILALSIISLVLYVITYIYMFRCDKITWKAFCVFWIFRIILAAFTIITYSAYGVDTASIWISLVAFVLIIYYYQKRKIVLFGYTLEELTKTQAPNSFIMDELKNKTDSGGPKMDVSDGIIYESNQTVVETTAPIEAIVDTPAIRFCHKCGVQLTAESKFCHKCGAGIPGIDGAKQ